MEEKQLIESKKELKKIIKIIATKNKIDGLRVMMSFSQMCDNSATISALWREDCEIKTKEIMTIVKNDINFKEFIDKNCTSVEFKTRIDSYFKDTLYGLKLEFK